MKITAITATCGRHVLLERSVRYFLDQDYPGDATLLIYNNSDVKQELGSWVSLLPNNRHINLINCSMDSSTSTRYNTLGSIYNDALTHVVPDCEVITHWDDDDTFLPNHLGEGIEGYRRALEEGKIAYKPEKSYYRHAGGVELMGNNMEPSIFVQAQHMKLYGYSDTTTDQHLHWFNPLREENKILVDPNGKPTMVYDWNNDVPTWKTSGAANNFENYRSFSQDHGDRIITPAERKDIIKYYV